MGIVQPGGSSQMVNMFARGSTIISAVPTTGHPFSKKAKSNRGPMMNGHQILIGKRHLVDLRGGNQSRNMKKANPPSGRPLLPIGGTRERWNPSLRKQIPNPGCQFIYSWTERTTPREEAILGKNYSTTEASTSKTRPSTNFTPLHSEHFTENSQPPIAKIRK